MNLKEERDTAISQALQEFRRLTLGEFLNIENSLSFADRNLSQLAINIWRSIGKATNLASELWKLNLKEEAAELEDWKIKLTRMHRELVSEIK